MMYRLPQWTMLVGALAALIVLLLVIVSKLAPGDSEPPAAGKALTETTGQPLVDVRVEPSAIERQRTLFEPIKPALQVSVTEVVPGTYRANLESFGAVSARYGLALQSLVAGKIVSISDTFENGELFRENEVLATIDSTEYLAEVADAKANLATAEVSLLEAERSSAQAVIEWQEAGLEGEPDSELVLRKPQLAAARATVEQAAQALEVAQRRLEYTRVTVPFDGVVVSRDIAPGSYVQAGATLGEVFDRTRAEIRIALSARDWQNLPEETELLRGDWPVQLTSVEDGHHWQGYVLRVEHHIADDSRQRHLVVAVDEPLSLQQPLLPGVFVQADVFGRFIDGLWRLPASALSQQGEVWYLDSESQLNKFGATPVFSDKGFIYVRPPLNLQVGSTQVVTQPLNSYLPGMAAIAVTESNSSIREG